MTRFPDDQIDRIKLEVDLVRLVQDSGVELKRVGHELLGRCLFHSPDTTPSLSVNPEKGVWRCFACGVGGSCFDWVMKRDKVSFAHAKAILRARLGAGGALVVSRKVSRDLPQVLKPTAEDRERLKWVVQKYHELLLTGTTPATAYLERRGVHDQEAIRTFKLGYADRTLCYGSPRSSRVTTTPEAS